MDRRLWDLVRGAASVIIQPKVDTAYFFETEHEGERHPHYGHVLQLEENRIVSMTWVNAAL